VLRTVPHRCGLRNQRYIGAAGADERVVGICTWHRCPPGRKLREVYVGLPLERRLDVIAQFAPHPPSTGRRLKVEALPLRS